MKVFYNKNKTGFNLTTIIISVMLTVVIFFSAFPIISFADDIEETDNDALETVVVHELEDERTENTKHFLMSDQSIKAVVYNEPVHYEEDGK